MIVSTHLGPELLCRPSRQRRLRVRPLLEPPEFPPELELEHELEYFTPSQAGAPATSHELVQ